MRERVVTTRVMLQQKLTAKDSEVVIWIRNMFFYDGVRLLNALKRQHRFMCPNGCVVRSTFDSPRVPRCPADISRGPSEGIEFRQVNSPAITSAVRY